VKIVERLQSLGANVGIVAFVTYHDSTNGFIYFNIDGSQRCCDDSKIKPVKKVLKKGTMIKVTFQNDSIAEIRQL